MKTLSLSILACFFLLFGCDSNANKSSKKINSTKENFDDFFKRFNADSIFQYSRVIFPFKLEVVDEEDNNSTTKFIAGKEWKYFNLTGTKSGKPIIKKNILSTDKINVRYAVEDTGIGVEYYFINKQGLWWLSYAKDESD